MAVNPDSLENALAGDRAAREALSHWCLRQAFGLAYVDLGDVPNRQAVADEIAGEASLKAITSLDQFQPGSRFPAWLHRIVCNCLRDHFRRTDRAVPYPTYQRWIHDFLTFYGPEMEARIQQEYGEEPSAPHPILLQRLATDLMERPYRDFVRLSYEGRDNAVLETVQGWLRSFMGMEQTSLYHQDEAGEWIGIDLASEEETEAAVMQQEFIDQVNEHLAELQPLCRRLLRWHYLDQLRVAEIARLERMSERTAYRRLENCAAAFRARLNRDRYFCEFTRKDEAPVGRRGG